MASPSTRTQVTYLVTVPTVALIALLIGLSLRPGPADPPTPTPGGSGAAVATPGPTPFRTPFRSAGPNEYPPSTQSGPCELPDTLPAPREPVAAPVVETGDVALLFSSFLYRRTGDGELVIQDRWPRNLEYGLWFAPAASKDEARLLLEGGTGAVVPLALAPAADVAAVWWLPDRRDRGEDDCIGGIYLFWIETGESRLIKRGAWWNGGADSDGGPVTVDEYVAGRDYRLPRASFSSNGRFLALAQATSIAIHRVAPGGPEMNHIGDCPEWAWSPMGATFAAACEGMTSAWVAQPGIWRDVNLAVPTPVKPSSQRHFEEIESARSIGVTRGGDVRVVRFYGYPPGCDTPGCEGPGPAYTVTTVDGETGTATSSVVETALYVAGSRLSPDASWVYASGLFRRPPRVIDLSGGGSAIVRFLGAAIGASAADSTLFGRRQDEDSRRVVITSLRRNGGTQVVGSIGWAIGSKTRRPDPVIPAWGLVAVKPPG